MDDRDFDAQVAANAAKDREGDICTDLFLLQLFHADAANRAQDDATRRHHLKRLNSASKALDAMNTDK